MPTSTDQAFQNLQDKHGVVIEDPEEKEIYRARMRSVREMSPTMYEDLADAFDIDALLGTYGPQAAGLIQALGLNLKDKGKSQAEAEADYLINKKKRKQGIFQNWLAKEQLKQREKEFGQTLKFKEAGQAESLAQGEFNRGAVFDLKKQVAQAKIKSEIDKLLHKKVVNKGLNDRENNKLKFLYIQQDELMGFKQDTLTEKGRQFDVGEKRQGEEFGRTADQRDRTIGQRQDQIHETKRSNLVQEKQANRKLLGTLADMKEGRIIQRDKFEEYKRQGVFKENLDYQKFLSFMQNQDFDNEMDAKKYIEDIKGNAFKRDIETQKLSDTLKTGAIRRGYIEEQTIGDFTKRRSEGAKAESLKQKLLTSEKAADFTNEAKQIEDRIKQEGKMELKTSDPYLGAQRSEKSACLRKRLSTLQKAEAQGCVDKEDCAKLRQWVEQESTSCPVEKSETKEKPGMFGRVGHALFGN